MGSHGQRLLKNESSAEISSLITLHYLLLRIADVHSSYEPTEDLQMETLKAEVNIQMFQHEIQEWRTSVPMSIRNMRTLIPDCVWSSFCLSPEL
jgi:hypothetical protein